MVVAIGRPVELLPAPLSISRFPCRVDSPGRGAQKYRLIDRTHTQTVRRVSTTSLTRVSNCKTPGSPKIGWEVVILKGVCPLREPTAGLSQKVLDRRRSVGSVGKIEASLLPTS